MATYLVGDIQGCQEPLLRLLDLIRFDPASDRLWCAGDLVARGGHSLEVLRLLHGFAPRVSVTLGNHDLALIAAHQQFPKGGCSNAETDAILTAPDGETLLTWLKSQPLAVFSERFRLLRVHAGVVPDWDWRTTVALASEVSTLIQGRKRGKSLRKLFGNGPRRWDPQLRGWKRLRCIANVLTRLRFCDAHGRMDLKWTGPPGSRRKPMQPWFKHRHRATRDVRIAFGHWAAMGLRLRKRFLALDSGCVWGGHLSAYRLDDDQLFQVPASPPRARTG